MVTSFDLWYDNRYGNCYLFCHEDIKIYLSIFSNEEGYHTGFGVDVLQAVCKEAGVECKTVMDDYLHCMTTAGSGKDKFYIGGIGESS